MGPAKHRHKKLATLNIELIAVRESIAVDCSLVMRQPFSKQKDTMEFKDA